MMLTKFAILEGAYGCTFVQPCLSDRDISKETVAMTTPVEPATLPTTVKKKSFHNWYTLFAPSKRPRHEDKFRVTELNIC